MVRRVTRSSPDSDDTLPGEDSDEFGRDDTFLIDNHSENKFYGAVPGGSSGNYTAFGRFCDSLYRQLYSISYLCPGFLPWTDCGPATEQSGMFVIKLVGALYGLIIMFDILAAYGNPGACTFTTVIMVILLFSIFFILLVISRKPQNRVGLMYATPGLPFVPVVAISVNIYLVLNLSMLTLLRFTIWMTLGLIMYFKYGIQNSTLETNPPAPPEFTPPTHNAMECTIIPPPLPPRHNRPVGDRNIFEGDDNDFYNFENPESLLQWHVTEPVQSQNSGINSSYRQVESRYNTRTHSTTSHASSRPPWAYPESTYDAWDD